jgi:hypothetical protein
MDSILSKPEGDSLWDEVQFDAHDVTATEYLEAKFARRDRILDQISQGKSRTFVELLRRHEQEVRSSERERLALTLLYKKRTESTTTSSADEPKPPTSRGNSRSTTTSAGSPGLNGEESAKEPAERRRDLLAAFLATADEFLTYELFTTVPATFSFIAQTLIEYTLYEITSILVWRVRRLAQSDHDKYQDRLMTMIFLIGLMLMRASGVLYWWLSDSDYGCVKFELHNRLRLGMWDARVLHWTSGTSWARCFLFVFGYYLCFESLLHFLYRSFMVWDQSESLMKQLPSSNHDDDVCLADLDLFSCEAAMSTWESQDEFLDRADGEHTWRFWSGRSHEFYWVEGSEGPGSYGYPLLSWNRELLILLITCGVSLSALTWYGFIFWHKY